MSIFSPEEKDVKRLQDAASQVIKDAVMEVATVLVPAIAKAAAGISATVTIQIEPITITIAAKEQA